MGIDFGATNLYMYLLEPESSAGQDKVAGLLFTRGNWNCYRDAGGVKKLIPEPETIARNPHH